MSAELDLIQAARDMDFHGADYYSGGFKEALERAKKAARELFTPMAKPLVWEFFDGCWVSGPYKLDKNRWTFDNSETHITVENGFYIDIAAQKAACESHHLARFKELLA